MKSTKCVMVIDPQLSVGIIANTAAILGMTLGKRLPEIIGPNVYDEDGTEHLGIIEFPVPILKSDSDTLNRIRSRVSEPEFDDVVVVDFSDLSQGCKTYEEFTLKMQNAPESSLTYHGIALCGPAKKISRLTGSMGLLR